MKIQSLKLGLFTLLSIVLSLSVQFVSAQSLQIKAPFARATNPGQTVGAGYLTIENPTATADKLVGATFAKSESVQIHEMKMDGDHMMMHEISGLTIPANGKVELKPGGYHLMFMGVKEPLKDGDTITVTLQFEKAGKVQVQMPVKMLQAMKMNH